LYLKRKGISNISDKVVLEKVNPKIACLEIFLWMTVDNSLVLFQYLLPLWSQFVATIANSSSESCHEGFDLVIFIKFFYNSIHDIFFLIFLKKYDKFLNGLKIL